VFVVISQSVSSDDDTAVEDDMDLDSDDDESDDDDDDDNGDDHALAISTVQSIHRKHPEFNGSQCLTKLKRITGVTRCTSWCYQHWKVVDRELIDYDVCSPS